MQNIICIKNSFEENIQNLKDTFFDLFQNVETNEWYVSDGLDIVKIEQNENGITLFLVGKEKFFPYATKDCFSMQDIEDAMYRGNYKNVNHSEFYSGATQWLKTNGKIKYIGDY